MSTLKKDIIKAFSYAPTVDGLADNQVIFLTPAGIIAGKLPTDSQMSNQGVAFISALLKKTAEPYSESSLEGNDGYIQLTNARLLPLSGAPVEIGDIVLFFDQIIGVKIGTVN